MNMAMVNGKNKNSSVKISRPPLSTLSIELDVTKFDGSFEVSYKDIQF